MFIKEKEVKSKLITFAKSESRLLIMNYEEFKNDLMKERVEEYGKKKIRNMPGSGEKMRVVKDFRAFDKGSLVWFHGHREPIKGMRKMEALQNSFVWKKAIALFIQFADGKKTFKKKGVFKKLFILVSAIVHYDFYIQFVHHAIRDYIFDSPKKYCQSVRELYRVMKKFPRERDIACFYLDTDHAYRFRLQDLVMEIDKKAFRRNPLKELLRVLDIAIDREPFKGKGGTMRGKIEGVKKMLPFIYWGLKIFKPKLLEEMLEIVEKMRVKEIKPSKEDIYWMNQTRSYSFGGVEWSIRKLIQ